MPRHQLGHSCAPLLLLPNHAHTTLPPHDRGKRGQIPFGGLFEARAGPTPAATSSAAVKKEKGVRPECRSDKRRPHIGKVRSSSFPLCLRRQTRSARRKETRRFCGEELRAQKNVPVKRLSDVFHVRRLLPQTPHPKSLRVSVPPFPPRLAPQAPFPRDSPYLTGIRVRPLLGREE